MGRQVVCRGGSGQGPFLSYVRPLNKIAQLYLAGLCMHGSRVCTVGDDVRVGGGSYTGVVDDGKGGGECRNKSHSKSGTSMHLRTTLV